MGLVAQPIVKPLHMTSQGGRGGAERGPHLQTPPGCVVAPWHCISVDCAISGPPVLQPSASLCQSQTPSRARDKLMINLRAVLHWHEYGGALNPCRLMNRGWSVCQSAALAGLVFAVVNKPLRLNSKKQIPADINYIYMHAGICHWIQWALAHEKKFFFLSAALGLSPSFPACHSLLSCLHPTQSHQIKAKVPRKKALRWGLYHIHAWTLTKLDQNYLHSS